MSDAAPATEADNAAPAPAEAVTAEPQVEESTETTTSTETPETKVTADNWRDILPDDIKASPSLEKFETIEGLAKSYVNLEGMLGSDKVPIPKGEDAEAWERFYKAGGRPENSEGYGFTEPEKIPDGMVYSKELDTRLADISLQNGLNVKQAQGVREALMGIVAEGATKNLEASEISAAEQAKQSEKALADLKTEWGQAFDERSKIAGAAINELFPPEFVAKLEAAGMANDPIVAKSAYDMGVKLIGEKELLGSVPTEAAPGDLDAKIADHRKTYEVELKDARHPDHQLRVSELTDLFNRRYPDG